MRFKLIAAAVVVAALLGTSAGVALATSRSTRPSSTTTGVEHYWVSNWNPKTGNPTAFVGNGLFTDAGKLSGPNGDKATLSQGGFVVNSSKIKFAFGGNPHTCFVIVTVSGTISLHHGTGAYAGISGTLPVSGKLVGVLPRLKNGKCNGGNNVQPLETVGVLSGSGKVTLG